MKNFEVGYTLQFKVKRTAIDKEAAREDVDATPIIDLIAESNAASEIRVAEPSVNPDHVPRFYFPLDRVVVDVATMYGSLLASGQIIKPEIDSMEINQQLFQLAQQFDAEWSPEKGWNGEYIGEVDAFAERELKKLFGRPAKVGRIVNFFGREKDFDLIWDAIRGDLHSKALDPELREQLEKAYDRIMVESNR